MIKKIFLDNYPFKNRTCEFKVGSYEFSFELTYKSNYELMPTLYVSNHGYKRNMKKLLPLNWISMSSTHSLSKVVSAIVFNPIVTQTMLDVSFQNVHQKTRIMDHEISMSMIH